MSGRIPRDRQGGWRGQRGRGSRGPARGPSHPPMPLPDEVVLPEESGREPSEDGNDGREEVARRPF